MNPASTSEIVSLKKTTYDNLMKDYNDLENVAINARADAYELKKLSQKGITKQKYSKNYFTDSPERSVSESSEKSVGKSSERSSTQSSEKERTESSKDHSSAKKSERTLQRLPDKLRTESSKDRSSSHESEGTLQRLPVKRPYDLLLDKFKKSASFEEPKDHVTKIFRDKLKKMKGVEFFPIRKDSRLL